MSNFFDKDVGVALSFTLLDEDGSPFDTTGYTLELLVEGVGAYPLESISASGGTCRYVTEAADFPAGVYKAQVRGATAGDVVVRYWDIDNIAVGTALEEA